MAIKIKKKKPETAEVEAELLDQPDQVLAATQDTFGWLTDNRNAVIGGLAIVVVCLVGFSVAAEKRDAGNALEAVPTLDAIGTAGASVGEEGVYPSTTARAEALRSAAAEAGGSVLGTVLEGASALELGDAGSATVAFDAALEAFDIGPEGAVLAFGAAAAHAEAGNLERALTLLDNVGGDNPQLAPVASLQAAQLIDAYGEPSNALSAYRDTLSSYPGMPGEGDVRNRVTQLEIQLGVEPQPEPEPAEEAADDAAEEGETGDEG